MTVQENVRTPIWSFWVDSNTVAVLSSFSNKMLLRTSSVIDSLSGQLIPFLVAIFRIFDTVFLETLQLRAMFRSLNQRVFSLRISRYLVIK
jgi:hypothetical protein